MSSTLLSILAETSWQLVWLVALVLVLERFAGARLAPRWRYGLWLVVVARLALPVQLQVPAGVWEREALEPAAWTGIPAPLGEMRATLERAPREARSIPRPVVPDAIGTENAVGPTRTSVVANPPTALPPERATPGDTQAIDWKSLCLLVWLTGAGAFFLRGLFAEVLFRRRLRRAARITDGRLFALLEEERRALGIRRRVRLFTTEAVDSPAVIGIFRPTLLLPPEVARTFRSAELRVLFLHELAHVRRADVALNALVCLLRCAYWFHPLVHLAASRLRAAQESARDWDALVHADAVTPHLYASTLIKLLERAPRPSRTVPALGFLSGGRHLRRRILMIAAFDSSKKSRRLGLALALVLSWTAFTAAAPSITKAPEVADREGQESIRSLVVERHGETPAWEAALRTKLAAPIDLTVDDASLGEVIEALRRLSGINFVVQRDAREDYGEDLFSCDIQGKPVEQVLAIVCRLANDDLGYSLVREAVFVGYRGDLPRSFELRFYNVAPLLEQLPEDYNDHEYLIDAVRTFTGPPDSWDEYEEISIEVWNELLVISQTAARHDEVEAFLERLLNRGARPAGARELWRTELDAALEKEISFALEDTDLEEAAEYLGQFLEVPVIVDRDYRDERIDLELQNVSIATAMDWLAELSDLRVRISDGAILVTETPDFTIEMYEVGDLVHSMEDGWDHLEWLVRSSVNRETWDEYEEPRYSYWGDLLIVQQMPAVHANLANFLDALRRASR